MTPQTIADVLRDMIWVAFKLAAPVILSALCVGIALSLVQVLTQVQEQTVTFVPKLVAVIICIALLFSHMNNTLTDFSIRMFDSITKIA